MATMVRWTPWTELAGVQNEMSRLMNGLFEGTGKSTQSWVPPLDVWETDNEVVYALDLPGVAEDEISVEADDGTLTVTAERTRTNEASDDRFGLPQGAAEDAIKAEFRNGVLEIHVAKPEQAKPRRIQVGSAPQSTIEGEATTTN
jgi:HSP20 family protein